MFHVYGDTNKACLEPSTLMCQKMSLVEARYL